jgi:hypothetical protein
VYKISEYVICPIASLIVLTIIVHRPVYYLRRNVTETGFCLRLQVKPTQLGPINRASRFLLTTTPTQ